MKTSISTSLIKGGLCARACALLLLGVVVMTPAYGQEPQRDKMVALNNEATPSIPPAAEHSERSILATGTEVLQDGGFEGGYYGSPTYGSQGVTGPWEWANGIVNPDGSATYADYLNPIWQNSGGVNAHTGYFMTYFNPFGPSLSQIAQGVLVPTGAKATLSFWLRIVPTGSSQYHPSDIGNSDRLIVCFMDPLTTRSIACPKGFLSGDSVGGAWVNYVVDVPSSVATGKTAKLQFQVVEVGTTIFQLDDISLLVSASSGLPTANFSFSPASPAPGQTVTFTDTSTGSPTGWSWSFGDGSTSTRQSPAHAFASAGSYTVTLTASNSSGSNVKSQVVTVLAAGVAPTANFTFSPSNPAPGQTVVFLDASTGEPSSWFWSFGDGDSATLRNLSHTYAQAGSYSVTLTVSNNSGSNAITKIIQVSSAPSQAFTYVLPSSAHSAGSNGAFYTTELTIANRGTTTATITIQFVGHDQEGSGGQQHARTLQPGASVTYDDVLGSLFGVSSGYGGILIKSDSSALKIVGQTCTPPPSGLGTFGQSVPGLTSASFVTPSTSQSLIALRQDAAFRTNAVVMNVSQATAHVRLLLLGADASTLGSSEFDLAPLAMTQISGVVTALGAPVGTTGAVLVVSTTTPGAQIASYATVIDNVTNDPRTILP